MSAVPRRKVALATLDELVEESIRIIREEGEPTRIAVPRVLDALTPDGDAVEYLLRAGLIATVNARINSGWVPGDAATENVSASGLRDGRRITGQPRRSRVQVGLELLRSRNYEGADGKRKVVVDFTLADCLHLLAFAESKQRGYAQLVKFARTAVAFMRTTGSARLGDLPEHDLGKVGQYLASAPEDK